MEHNGLQVPLSAWQLDRAATAKMWLTSLPLPDADCSMQAARIMAAVSVLGF